MLNFGGLTFSRGRRESITTFSDLRFVRNTLEMLECQQRWIPATNGV